MSPDYSIVVPAYNEEHYLPATLAALKEAMAATLLSGELIVTDNNSTDATAEIARRCGAQVVFEPLNQISRARNAGARAARGRYLVFVDADTRISPELLRDALDRLESGRYVGGGAVVRFAEQFGWPARFAVGVWNRLSRTFGFAAGCFVYCAKSDFDAAGGFSEQVYASEEIWFSRRLRALGRRQGKKFCIIAEHAAVSSGRKLEWYGPGRQILFLLMVTFFPVFVRYRRLCGFWYERPKS
jgi:glycosyltransferase involved in cell wall biosynthesis